MELAATTSKCPSLPPEIWLPIAELHRFEFEQAQLESKMHDGSTVVNLDEPHWTTLRALSLTSRTLSNVAQPLLFYALIFDLQKNLVVEDPLQTTAYFKYSVDRIRFYSSSRIAPYVRVFSLNGIYRNYMKDPWRPSYLLDRLSVDALEALQRFTKIARVQFNHWGFKEEELHYISQLKFYIPHLTVSGCFWNSVAPQGPGIAAQCVRIPGQFTGSLTPVIMSEALRELEMDLRGLSNLTYAVHAENVRYKATIAGLIKLSVNASDVWLSIGDLLILPSFMSLCESLSELHFRRYDMKWEDMSDTPLQPYAMPNLKILDCAVETLGYFTNLTSITELQLHHPFLNWDVLAAEQLVPHFNDYEHLFSNLKVLSLYLGEGVISIDLVTTLAQACSNLQHLQLEQCFKEPGPMVCMAGHSYLCSAINPRMA
jgi:hypothetical protein